MRGIILAAALVVMSTPAFAAPKFAPYEGRDSVHSGRGGTRISRGGIDFWTSGTPPRRFQVLGIYTDKRNDHWITQLFGGEAIGSKGVAKHVRKLGGDAVIVLDRESQIGGTTGSSFGNWGWGSYWGSYSSEVYNNVTTALLVVRYLDNAPDHSSGAEVNESAGLISAISPVDRSAMFPEPPRGAQTPLPPGVKQLAPEVWLYPAPTASGYCIVAPVDYRGRGTVDMPAITSGMPRCSKRPS